MLYSVLDIESTSGKLGSESIIEIAIYTTDGNEIHDQFISLVNPEKKIDFFVQKLTGITDKMVRSAPKFHELAKRIVEITKDTILVGHNVQFDYRMLRQEFNRLGYQFSSSTLDTLEMSRTLLPNQQSYSLGKLVKSVGIPILNRHRASGDAMATVELFKLLLLKDTQKNILTTSIKSENDETISNRLLPILKELPKENGVFYLHNKEREIIFLDTANTIKQKVTQLFLSRNKKSRKIQEETYNISTELTGGSLITTFKGYHELEKNKPKYNNPTVFKYAIYFEKNMEGILQINIKKSSELSPLRFTSMKNAKAAVSKLIRKHKLVKRRNELEVSTNEYNERVEELKTNISLPFKNFVVTDSGRKKNEKSFILVVNSTIEGYGFYNFDHQTRKVETLRNLMSSVGELNQENLKNLLVNLLICKDIGVAEIEI